ncbi:hypothetical protein A3H89_00935 [Candidatus Amesbacteria bacterium RIFCSPLOWO2_02_FULL_48_11]|uniref:DNA-directed DNA polymerase n=2 Tax=Candidatus Amesiibacteriota TaxID=1752730 RepID=A0A1F4Z5D8_9BACT|nr:MAG: PHP domain protein, DNA polymerase (family X) [Candidatus Amesbacteria bacterium GW2011_GWC1_48_10]OGC96712.1 MAG: hypothetical protein A3C34_00970 [Candidatus Amesbacteria bacterium RIFCSPHIGHO2_02_FULL_48_21]OGD01370.1 MAG: hypothetical protein A3E17_05160 [Candidatus Amesbacteria bacterium RIFCSPHIGHO2_12_FULL_48_14]OGD05898.1 MAG: hypothetical protein A3H89_00935 [Candidatus Amesbacteria bacterium RIFCSPLOWO2_02_FULL_48_11]OGD06824.1 MAG: hypothetical protein A3B58_02300 [Candidatus
MKTTKTMTNLEIAKLFRAVAAALSLTKGDNRFRVIAYERAADAVEHSSSEIKDLWDNQELDTLTGIGSNIASHLDELFKTGKVRHFDQILKPFPPALFELLEIPGIGPKNALKLCKALGISQAHSAISRLEKAAKNGHIRSLIGFGIESEADIIKNIREFRGRSRRMLLPIAQTIADEITAWLKKSSFVSQVYPLGSLRRQASTVGDVDIAVSSDNAPAVIAHFTNYPKKSRVLEAGDKTASLILPSGFQVDLMVQPPAAFGSLLQHFTGSKHHNILLREYALKKGLSLSEYGIKKISKSAKLSPSLRLREGRGESYQGDKGIVKFSNEKSFYHFLGLDWIPPELREGNEEINRSKNHTLPRLIELKDIKGDLQIHSNIDVQPSHDLGESSISDLVRVASILGYEYIGLTEHNPSLSGHTPSQIRDLIIRKSDQIHRFNDEKSHENNILYVFNGLEIDILPDGRRALPDNCLELLDYACISIHSSFRLSRKAMTDRVLSAFDHPKIRFLAHPTGRLLGQREGVELDWDRIFDFCARQDKWLEIDAWPDRLDLPDVLVREAITAKIKLVIDTDSHAASHLSYMRYGVSVARRGWAEAPDIVNTFSLTKMRQLLQRG